MRPLAYILAFYLLLLSAVPCCDFDNCNDETKAQSADHEKESDCGNCSPFFSCEGCATATIAYPLAQFEISPIQIPAVYASYLQLSLPQVNYDFWQPPRVAV